MRLVSIVPGITALTAMLSSIHRAAAPMANRTLAVFDWA
jgi:hypothetical protein